VLSVEGELVNIVIPGFSATEVITITTDNIPSEVLSIFEPDTRVYARVNIGVEDSQHLDFSDWSTS
jgi:hypothetical protein